MAKILYHGSSDNFDSFSFEKIGTKSGISGAGFGLYFSESKADALGYGDIVYECMVQLEGNCLSNDKITLNEVILGAILNKAEEVSGINFFDTYYSDLETDEEVIKALLLNNDSDTKLFKKIIKFITKDMVDKMRIKFINNLMKILVEFGYKYTTDTETPENKTITHYIIYDLDCISILNKEKF